MKKILLYLSTLLIILIIADRVIYFTFSKYIFAKTLNGDTGGAVNYMLQKKKNIDFFILGSSRAKYHIDPSLLTAVYDGNGYNAGKSSFGGVIFNDMLLHLLLNRHITPKMILLQLDPSTFISNEEEDFTNELLPLYPFIDDSKELKDFIEEHIAYPEKIKLFFHSYRYNGKFFGIWYNYAKRGSFKDNNGFEKLQGKIDTTLFQQITPVKTLNYSITKINILKDLMQTCKVNQIKLAVVYPPTYKNYYFSKAAIDTITKILQEDDDITIYDFADINKLPSMQPAALWKDAHHLNSDGAIIFSTLLNKAMVAIP